MGATEIIENSEKIISPDNEECIIFEKRELGKGAMLIIACAVDEFPSLLDKALADTENKMGWKKYIDYWKSKGWL